MPKTLFDHLKVICNDQRLDYYDTLDEADKKTFTPFMVNRFLSMHADYLPMVNMFQQVLNTVGPRETYLFYSQCFPKQNVYLKYVKAEKEEKYEDWLIELVKQHFMVSMGEATTYIWTYYKSDSGKAELRQLCEDYGIDPKQIKKAKL